MAHCVDYLGDLLQRWTNNYWHSPLHRVVNPTITNTRICEDGVMTSDLGVQEYETDSRQSIVFFTGAQITFYFYVHSFCSFCVSVYAVFVQYHTGYTLSVDFIVYCIYFE